MKCKQRKTSILKQIAVALKFIQFKCVVKVMKSDKRSVMDYYIVEIKSKLCIITKMCNKFKSNINYSCNNYYFFHYKFGTNTRNRARPRTYSKLWSA